MTAARLGAEAARRLFLARHGLAGAQSPDLLAEIERLGFVQIDSIATVERAHHMILASRRKSYRPQHLKTLHERRREVFEHWTHDAAAIPTRFYPYWRLRFRRDEARLLDRWRRWRRDGFEARIDEMLAHVRDAGPVMARDVGGDEPRGGGGWWDWHPSKTALEFLWRTGALAVSGRQGFQKQFDLAERVIPADRLAERPSEAATIDWACSAALDRLGFAASGDIARFWELVTPAEAKAWAAERLGDGLIEVEVEGRDGTSRRMLARPDVLDAAAEAPKPTTAIRILSPFDPALRDRKRAAWLFGFDYRIEIFVPEAKRRYGYYVFPVLEGDRPIGRIDMKREGPGGPLAVRAFWPEPGVAFGAGRRERLGRAIERTARFAEADGVVFAEDWLRSPL